MQRLLLVCAVFVSLVTVPVDAGNLVIRQSVRQPLFRQNTTVIRQQVIRQPVVRQQVIVPHALVIPQQQFLLPQQFILPQALPYHCPSCVPGAAIILR